MLVSLWVLWSTPYGRKLCGRFFTTCIRAQTLLVSLWVIHLWSLWSRGLSMFRALRNILTWTFTSDEDRERAETRIRSFAACEIRQEFVVARLQNPGVEDVQISINTVSCGDNSEDKPTLGR